MTVDEVKRRLEEIRQAIGDDEQAHALEDELFADVLRHYAGTGSAIAIEALKSKVMDFARHCA